jgi:AcrR family transcriptional regulator
MSEKINRRQFRTKELLRKSLIDLIERQGLDSITVTDISNHANINRGTFYLHYKDVADMLEQLKDEAFEKIKLIVLELNLTELMKYAENDTPYPKMIQIFEEFSRNAGFFKIIFGPKGDLSFTIRFKELMKAHIYNKLANLQPQKEKMLVPIDYIIAYMASANLGILMHWFESGMMQSPQELGQIMTRLINHGPITSSGVRARL